MALSAPNDIEKAAGLNVSHTPGSGASTPKVHHRAGDRLREFFHPNGRRVCVASDPADAEGMRARLKSTAGQEDEFDVYISGTTEHLEALRHAHTHQEEQRKQLQQQHAEVYDRFTKVHSELDSLSRELDRITDHGVSLDAHFSRFGYSAHIKSYDDDDDALSRTGTNPSRRNSSADVADHGENPLTFLRIPVVRQYLHKGIIWRASATEEVMSFELFVDLLYVGIIAINGDAASEEPTGESLLRFVITMALSWKIWNDMALLISWFQTDDLFVRFSILFLLVCLFGYTTNIVEAFDHTYATLIGFYLAARLYMFCYLVFVSITVPMVRGTMFSNALVAIISIALWIGSIHVEYPYQLALIWIALALDFAGHAANAVILKAAQRLGGATKAWSDKFYEFVPALNIEHRTERTNAFVTLVFGYTVVAILYQSAIDGIDAFFGKGIMGLIQAFCFNWIYFEIDQFHVHTHAIRRHMLSSFLWAFAHLPFVMSFVLGGGALARLVLTSDTESTHMENLTETYQLRSSHDVEAGHRWFYCGGFGVALVFMALISISHVHKDMKGARISKRFRLAYRVVTAIVLICLPTAESLNSLQLIGTVTGLVVLLLLVELWGSSTSGTRLVVKEKAHCYTGQCGKKKLREYVRRGQELDLDEMHQSSKLKEEGLAAAPM